jgi:hypothetical protein
MSRARKPEKVEPVETVEHVGDTPLGRVEVREWAGVRTGSYTVWLGERKMLDTSTRTRWDYAQARHFAEGIVAALQLAAPLIRAGQEAADEPDDDDDDDDDDEGVIVVEDEDDETDEGEAFEREPIEDDDDEPDPGDVDDRRQTFLRWSGR